MRVTRFHILQSIWLSAWVYLLYVYFVEITRPHVTLISADNPPILNLITVALGTPVIFVTYWFSVAYYFMRPDYSWRRKKTKSEIIDEMDARMDRLEERVEAKTEMVDLLLKTLERHLGDMDLVWGEVDVTLQEMEAINNEA